MRRRVARALRRLARKIDPIRVRIVIDGREIRRDLTPLP